MRSTVSALTARGHAATLPSANSAISAARVLFFLISIASILFRLSMINFDALVCNGYAKEKLILQIALGTTSTCDDAPAKSARCLFWHQDCKFGPRPSLEL
ncbi:hypothetical protein ACVMHZ_003930 [Bradyrhizobium liaoningense]